VPLVLLPLVSVEQAFAWIDAYGVRHDLTDPADGYAVLVGITDRWMPATRWIEDRIPFVPGAKLRAATSEPLDFDLPIEVSASSPAQLHQRIRDLMGWFNPMAGSGVLESTAPDGSVRVLACRAELVRVPEDLQARGATEQDVSIPLHAPDPYWTDPAPTVVTYTLDPGPAGGFFKDPFFPMYLASSTVFATPTLNNPGDFEGYPTWAITGPGSNPVLRNLTSGKEIVFGHALGAGEQILIDTRQDDPTVTDGLGTNLFPRVALGSDLWPMARGFNSIQLEMDGATAASSIVLSYTPRFIGP
jgi:hypothetical protein